MPTLNEVINDQQIRREFFRSLPLFAGVEEEISDAIADNSNYIYRKYNHQLIVQGDPALQAYIILSGLARISRTVEGIDGRHRNYHLSYRGPAQPLGINNMVCDENHTYTMEVIENSHLMQIPKAVFMEQFNGSQYLRRNVIRYINHRFYETSDRLQNNLQFTVKEARYVEELLDILDALSVQVIADGRGSPDELKIDWLNLDRLAERLGCNPSVISKAKQKLKTANIIEVHFHTGTTYIKKSNIKVLRFIYENMVGNNLEQAISKALAKGVVKIHPRA